MLRWARVARVASAGAEGMPHLVPICPLLHRDKLYFGSGKRGRKVWNVKANPQLALTADAYVEDWSGLRGVMVQGRAAIVERGPRFRLIRRLLYRKYPQYPRDAALDESDSLMIELTPTHVFTWGFD
jgi:nitroimidazol reductase NimA-like FMN-containing flavoprotein (pyridoxamine 5'-phosphate oxidase superfamily)